MRAGEFEDGAHVLRAKIDMASPNITMRDPILYRIKRAPHYRTGMQWCIYPMYDFAHCLSDSIEKITHSICTLEFENNRPLYDWILDQLNVDSPPSADRIRSPQSQLYDSQQAKTDRIGRERVRARAGTIRECPP